jgi:hypothetical protein
MRTFMQLLICFLVLGCIFEVFVMCCLVNEGMNDWSCFPCEGIDDELSIACHAENRIYDRIDMSK